MSEESVWFEENYGQLYQMYMQMRNDLLHLGAPFKAWLGFDEWWTAVRTMTTLSRGREDGPGSDLHVASVKQIQKTAVKCPPRQWPRQWPLHDIVA
jgi:hypothetical protein